MLRAQLPQVFRWRPVSSGGFAHQASETFSYQGYVIPKGTQIIGNHWSISRDPEVFPNPNEFRLQRWFVMGDIAKAEIRKDVNHVGYGALFIYFGANSILKKRKFNPGVSPGFGRRICAGQNVANRSMYSMLTSFPQFGTTNTNILFTHSPPSPSQLRPLVVGL